MKTKLKILVLLILLTGNAGNIFAQAVELPLTHVKLGKQHAEFYKAVHCSLKIDTIQQKTGEGIRFAIKIQNDSTANLEIVNPLDGLLISLIDGKNKEIPFVDVPKGLSRNGHGRRPFEVSLFSINNQGQKSFDMDSTQTVILPAKGFCEIRLSIKKVPAPTDGDAAKTMPIEKGTYFLVMMMGIQLEENRKQHKINSMVFHKDNVKIRYGGSQ